MTGEELKRLRTGMGLTVRQLIRAAYNPHPTKMKTMYDQIQKYESGSRPVPALLARLVYCMTVLQEVGELSEDSEGVPVWPDAVPQGEGNA